MHTFYDINTAVAFRIDCRANIGAADTNKYYKKPNYLFSICILIGTVVAYYNM